MTPEDFQPLAMIPRPGVPIEDWMVELTTCADECVNIIRALAVQSDTGADRVPPLMLSRCMRGGKTTLLAHLFDKVKDIENYCPIFISFNGFSGIQPRSGETGYKHFCEPLQSLCCSRLHPLMPRVFLATRAH